MTKNSTKKKNLSCLNEVACPLLSVTKVLEGSLDPAVQTNLKSSLKREQRRKGEGGAGDEKKKKQARAINGFWVALFSPSLSSFLVKYAAFL